MSEELSGQKELIFDPWTRQPRYNGTEVQGQHLEQPAVVKCCHMLCKLNLVSHKSFNSLFWVSILNIKDFRLIKC